MLRQKTDGRTNRRGGAEALHVQLADLQEIQSYANKWVQAKHAIGRVMESAPMEIFIISIVCLYAMLVFIMLTFQNDLERADAENGTGIVEALVWVDMIVLFIFLVEITLKSVAFGAPYFTDPWNKFDGFIVLLSIGLAVLERVYSDDATLKRLLSFRGILRLMRLVVIFRKVSETQSALSRIQLKVQGMDLSSPVEMVLDTMQQLAHNPRLMRDTRRDVLDAIQVISGGTLYEINTDDIGEGNALAAEATAWINNASGDKKKKGAEKQKTFAVNVGKLSEYTMRMVEAYPTEVQREVMEMLEIDALQRWHYDMFRLDGLTKKNCLPLMSTRLLKSTNLWDSFVADESSFEKFISHIRDSYVESNPYHNAVHATDVMQTTFWFCNTGELCKIASCDAEDFFSLIFAAVIHDVGHQAVSNIFMCKTQHPFSLRYNDKSVLENMHVSFAYSAMAEDETMNIFSKVSKEKWDKIRANVISLVLATDMSFHFAKLGKLKSRIAATQEKDTFPNPEKKEDKELLMQVAIHACDISNPSKTTRIYLAWTEKVLEEFFNQGDREKGAGLPPSMFMDRVTTNIAKCQIGFIDFIVNPMFVALKEVVPALEEATHYLQVNKEFWLPKVEMMEEQMKKGDYSLPSVDEDTDSKIFRPRQGMESPRQQKP
jgi:cAMP-specific phosphodiesterase 4/calcium/calmodulin-dependent 3',5'-cyclic nucleotide phosphodiesterase